MAEVIAQTEFDGHPVTERKVKITKAGDGLSEALQLHGLDIQAGQTYDIVLRVKAGGATFKPVKAGDEDGDYQRIDNLVAQSATVVSSEVVAEVLDEHEAKIAEAREQAKEAREGIKRLGFDDEDDAKQADEDGVTPDNVRHIGGDDWDDDPADGADDNPGLADDDSTE